MTNLDRDVRRASLAAVASLAIAFATPLQGQVRVEGEVIDNRTGLPVPGVIVQFPDLGLAALTDCDGVLPVRRRCARHADHEPERVQHE